MARTETKPRTTTWTPERRERQRQVANRLVAEGKFGGAATRGLSGRPKKRAPTADKLLRILRTAADRSALLPRQHETLRGARQLANVADALAFDRAHIEALIVTAIRQLVSDGQLPQMAVLQDDAVTFLNARSGEHQKRLREGLATTKGDLIVLRDLSVNDVQKFDAPAIVESAALLAAVTTRPVLYDLFHTILTDVAQQALGAMPNLKR